MRERRHRRARLLREPTRAAGILLAGCGMLLLTPIG
jgi:hypothetical protein